MGERNIRLIVEYDGTDYAGFQIQPNAPTIQGELERALERLTKEQVRVYGASRTDAGVHALGQVVNFRSGCSIPDERFREGLNRLLPQAIAVRLSERVPEEFHARKWAKSKVYRYTLLRSPTRAPVRGRFACPIGDELELEAMRRATEALLGERDFASFASAGGHNEITVRRVMRAEWVEEGEFVHFVIEANAFLYKMVRNIVGTLLLVGRGKLAPEEMERIIAARDRTQAGPTAPACGLCLVEVKY